MYGRKELHRNNKPIVKRELPFVLHLENCVFKIIHNCKEPINLTFKFSNALNVSTEFKQEKTVNYDTFRIPVNDLLVDEVFNELSVRCNYDCSIILTITEDDLEGGFEN